MLIVWTFGPFQLGEKKFSQIQIHFQTQAQTCTQPDKQFKGRE